MTGIVSTLIIEYRERIPDAEHGRALPSKQTKVELPHKLIESFARFLVLETRKYYESEQGQREFKEQEE